LLPLIQEGQLSVTEKIKVSSAAILLGALWVKSLASVFQSQEEDGKVMMKGYLQWSPVHTVYNRTVIKIGSAIICTPEKSIAASKHSYGSNNFQR
ncbi:MAG: hypothetical protein ABW098_16510, partial [Candidatus Thiodiazotropha sp.]